MGERNTARPAGVTDAVPILLFGRGTRFPFRTPVNEKKLSKGRDCPDGRSDPYLLKHISVVKVKHLLGHYTKIQHKVLYVLP